MIASVSLRHRQIWSKYGAPSGLLALERMQKSVLAPTSRTVSRGRWRARPILFHTVSALVGFRSANVQTPNTQLKLGVNPKYTTYLRFTPCARNIFENSFNNGASATEASSSSHFLSTAGRIRGVALSIQLIGPK